MPGFLANLPHLLMATIVIAAVSVLAATGTIPGSTAVAVIAGAAGISLGVGASSTGASGPAPIVSVTSTPQGGGPTSVATASTAPPAAAPPAA